MLSKNAFWLFFAFNIVGFDLVAAAAPKPACDHQLANPIYTPGTTDLQVPLGYPALEPDAGAQWTILDLTEVGPGASVQLTPTNVPLERLGVPQVDPATGSVLYQAVDFTLAKPLDKSHTYYIVAKRIHFEGCSSVVPQLKPVQIQLGTKPSGVISQSDAKGRDDADFYLNPTLDGATGKKASYTIDAKIAPRLWLKAPGTEWNPLHPGVIFTPGIDVKASSNPKEDGNSVMFHVPFNFYFPSPSSWTLVAPSVPMSVGEAGFVAEADKNFHDMNAVFAYSHWLSPKPLCCRKSGAVIFEPFFGIEVGENLKSQRAGAYPFAIERGTFGAHLGIYKMTQKGDKALWSIESDYVRRVLLNPEPIYVTNSQSQLELKSTGTNPRDHVITTITYNISKYFGVTANHEYGSLPPDYTLVDNKYTFGFTFKTKIIYRVKAGS